MPKKIIFDGNINLIGNPKNLILGENIVINQGVLLNFREKLLIGNNVHLSAYSQLHTGYLNLNLNGNLNRVHSQKSIIIEDNVWIAAGAIISAGVVIGKNSVIGANSVVTKNVEPNSFYAGSPARKIKSIKI